MSSSPRSRFVGSTLLLSSLALSMLVSPASAAGKTRWVDDDGKVGSSSCSGTKTAYRTIQKGVNAAGAGDTVKVCPGTYVGPVTIKGARTGLILRSVSDLGATIKARDEATFNTTYLVTIDDVDKVTVKGFKIRALLGTSHNYCDVSTGIRAMSAKNVLITGNDIRPSGPGAFCGVYDGISATDGTTGTISDNAVKDYRDDGIDLKGVSTNVVIDDNSVTFAHLNFVQATGGSAVLLDDGANGTVKSNTLIGPAAGPGDPSQPMAGVMLDGTGSATSVRGNTIARFAADIRIQHANGGNVHDNEMTGGQVGLDLLDGDTMQIYSNTSSGATVHGLFVAGTAAGSDGTRTTGTSVHHNDFRSNSNGSSADCKGSSSYVVSASAGNSFDLNDGNSSDPAALCEGSTVPK